MNLGLGGLLTGVSLFTGLVFVALLRLANLPRFRKAKLYFLPLMCGGLWFGWEILCIIFLRQDGNSLFSIDPGATWNAVTFVGLTAFICGCAIGALLYFGSTLLESKETVKNAVVFIVLGFILVLISASSIYIILGFIGWMD